jgi:hypothetical protein
MHLQRIGRGDGVFTGPDHVDQIPGENAVIARAQDQIKDAAFHRCHRYVHPMHRQRLTAVVAGVLDHATAAVTHYFLSSKHVFNVQLAMR